MASNGDTRLDREGRPSPGVATKKGGHPVPVSCGSSPGSAVRTDPGRRPAGGMVVVVVGVLVAAVCCLAFGGVGRASGPPAGAAPRALLGVTPASGSTAPLSLALFRGTLRVRWPVVGTTTGSAPTAPPV